MTAGYKKPHISMNRVKYGNKVKPVPQKKKKLELVKPSVLGLKRIYSKLAKSASWQQLDIMCEAIQWYRDALRYIGQVAQEKNTQYSAPTAKALHSWLAYTIEMAKCSTTKEKTNNCLAALKSAKYVCDAHGIKAPSAQTYLQKGKPLTKKLDTKLNDLNTKYDKLLTLLTQAYGDGITLKVSPTLTEHRKFDHSLNTMFYSISHVRSLAVRLRQDGLLPIVVEEAWHTARAQAFNATDKSKGRYLTDLTDQATFYKKILEHFTVWAAISPYTPKTLVKRSVKRVTKTHKVNAT